MRRQLSLVSLVLSLLGIGLAGYLTWIHYHPGDLVCTGGGCHVVQASRYSEIGGIPIALLGLLMFIALIALIGVREVLPDYEAMANSVILAMLVASVLYFAYLTWLEATEIHAWCQWCVTTSIVTLLLLLVEGYRFWRDYAEA